MKTIPVEHVPTARFRRVHISMGKLDLYEENGYAKEEEEKQEGFNC